MKNGKGAREKIGDTQSKGHWAREQRLKDQEGAEALRKSGGNQAARSKRVRAETEQAEEESYRLHGKKF